MMGKVEGPKSRRLIRSFPDALNLFDAAYLAETFVLFDQEKEKDKQALKMRRPSTNFLKPFPL